MYGLGRLKSWLTSNQQTDSSMDSEDELLSDDDLNLYGPPGQHEIQTKKTMKITFRDEVSVFEFVRSETEVQDDVNQKKVSFAKNVDVIDDGLDRFMDEEYFSKLTWWEQDLYKTYDIAFDPNIRPRYPVVTDVMNLESVIAREEARMEEIRKEKLKNEKFKAEFQALWEQRERDGEKLRQKALRGELGDIERSDEEGVAADESYKIIRKLPKRRNVNLRRKIAFDDCEDEKSDVEMEADDNQQRMEIDEEFNVNQQRMEIDEEVDNNQQPMEIDEKIQDTAGKAILQESISDSEIYNETLNDSDYDITDERAIILKTPRKKRVDQNIFEDSEDEEMPEQKSYAQIMRERRPRKKFNPDLKKLFNVRPLSPKRKSKDYMKDYWNISSGEEDIGPVRGHGSLQFEIYEDSVNSIEEAQHQENRIRWDSYAPDAMRKEMERHHKEAMAKLAKEQKKEELKRKKEFEKNYCKVGERCNPRFMLPPFDRPMSKCFEHYVKKEYVNGEEEKQKKKKVKKAKRQPAVVVAPVVNNNENPDLQPEEYTLNSIISIPGYQNVENSQGTSGDSGLVGSNYSDANSSNEQSANIIVHHALIHNEGNTSNNQSDQQSANIIASGTNSIESSSTSNMQSDQQSANIITSGTESIESSTSNMQSDQQSPNIIASRTESIESSTSNSTNMQSEYQSANSIASGTDSIETNTSNVQSEQHSANSIASPETSRTDANSINMQSEYQSAISIASETNGNETNTSNSSIVQSEHSSANNVTSGTDSIETSTPNSTNLQSGQQSTNNIASPKTPRTNANDTSLAGQDSKKNVSPLLILSLMFADTDDEDESASTNNLESFNEANDLPHSPALQVLKDKVDAEEFSSTSNLEAANDENKFEITNPDLKIPMQDQDYSEVAESQLMSFVEKMNRSKSNSQNSKVSSNTESNDLDQDYSEVSESLLMSFAEKMNRSKSNSQNSKVSSNAESNDSSDIENLPPNNSNAPALIATFVPKSILKNKYSMTPNYDIPESPIEISIEDPVGMKYPKTPIAKKINWNAITDTPETPPISSDHQTKGSPKKTSIKKKASEIKPNIRGNAKKNLMDKIQDEIQQVEIVEEVEIVHNIKETADGDNDENFYDANNITIYEDKTCYMTALDFSAESAFEEGSGKALEISRKRKIEEDPENISPSKRIKILGEDPAEPINNDQPLDLRTTPKKRKSEDPPDVESPKRAKFAFIDQDEVVIYQQPFNLRMKKDVLSSTTTSSKILMDSYEGWLAGVPSPITKEPRNVPKKRKSDCELENQPKRAKTEDETSDGGRNEVIFHQKPIPSSTYEKHKNLGINYMGNGKKYNYQLFGDDFFAINSVLSDSILETRNKRIFTFPELTVEQVREMLAAGTHKLGLIPFNP